MSDYLLQRLVDNEDVLNEVQELLSEAAKANRRIVPAVDWLLDNYYLIEEHIRTSKWDLPKGYSRGLPRLLNGQSTGLPRVYDIALELVSHGDGMVDFQTLLGYIQAYQEKTSLTLGELWAIPIMLRLALIENLRRVAVRVAVELQAQEQAGIWADRMLATAHDNPQNLILVVADMARTGPLESGAFVAELSRKLQGIGGSLAIALTWLEQSLVESGTGIDRVVQTVMQQQAADQVSISNSIRSLRSLDANDWRIFVETSSRVESILQGDPLACYRSMDFRTRDRYRHVVEDLARKTRYSEEHVAEMALDMAREAEPLYGNTSPRGHIGYYLVDRGIVELRRKLQTGKVSEKGGDRKKTAYRLVVYLGAVFGSALLVSAGIAYWAWLDGMSGWLLGILTVTAFLSGGGLASALVNWASMGLSAPHSLPCLDFSEGIPLVYRTLVVVPVMLTREAHIADLVEKLEIRFLANRDDNLIFGLLSDYTDAPQADMPEDERLLELAVKGITDLNQRYGQENRGPFYLFHRGRAWNPSEGVWMGWERKRGKLMELNGLLREGGKHQFTRVVGDLDLLPGVKYVITLDTDTLLPPLTAKVLAGTMAHPLNRICYDPQTKRVISGYGLLQPRVSASLEGSNQSPFARLNSGDAGLDPYTRAVSDVYQDVFSEGSFVGKGIYDVDAFRQIIGTRFPENRILSHDLLEGCYVRSGLASDVVLFEAAPVTYLANTERRRRWIRGDWQLLPWLFPRVPQTGGTKEHNPLSGLSRWKILDNLGRSLGSGAMVLMLVLGWFTASMPLAWTLVAIAMVVLPAILVALSGLFRKPADMAMLPHLLSLLRGLGRQLALAGLSLSCLVHDAWLSLGAIGRTLWRMFFSHRNFLEWRASESHDAGKTDSLATSLGSLWAGPCLALVLAIGLSLVSGLALLAALPILLLWLLSPVLTWRLSQVYPQETQALTTKQNDYLRALARKTWSYFETFVTESDNWLPPDNYQVGTVSKLAHRTSPTNMGLALLANLGAHDLGYLSAGALLKRSQDALASMAVLEKHRGHFFNWYDTRTRQALHPRYVSTVDSGNLAAHALTLAAGLRQMTSQAVFSPHTWQGLADTHAVLDQTWISGPSPASLHFGRDLARATKAAPLHLFDQRTWLQRLEADAQEIVKNLETRSGPQLRWWAGKLVQQCAQLLEDLDYLVPHLAASTERGSLPVDDAFLGSLRLSDLAGLQETLAAGGDQLMLAGSLNCVARLGLIHQLSLEAEKNSSMSFDFLYSKRRRFLAIGYQVDGHRRDSSFYDLLASEARLSAFLAIAQGQIPQESWFALGRSVAEIDGRSALFSWSGSMFEYLMPLLVMPLCANSLLDQTCKAVIAHQIDYGRKRAVPWGISESGYNAFDGGLNYQYHAFGVPGLGLKRGLDNDLVIAPYASALALLVTPEKACHNLQRLSQEGYEGDHGLFEAIDYTKSRVPTGQSSATVQSFMAHHQGMTLLAIVSQVLDRPMQKRFSSIPMIQATSLLLEEKIPRASTISLHVANLGEFHGKGEQVGPEFRTYNSPDTLMPEVHLLSNGRYHVMVSNAGGGYSRWQGLALTRWVEDPTRDNWGSFLYIQDVKSGEWWSNTYQPSLKKPDFYEVNFSEGRAEYRRRDFELETYTEIAVSPEDDIEIRRVRITNRSRTSRTIELSSYAEVVLASPASDLAHPGFSNLFVQTEIMPDNRAVLCTRRARSETEPEVWMFQSMIVWDARVVEVSAQTDRMRFIGRRHTVASPVAMQKPGALGGHSGSVLDPIVAIRYRIVLPPDSTATIDLVTGISASRGQCLGVVEKYQSKQFVNRAFELSRTHSQVVLQQINGTEADAQLYGRLTGPVLYAHPGLRANPAILAANTRGQSGLWAYSISGDLPLVLLLIKDPENIELVRQVIQAHSYWRQKGLALDLVILNEEYSAYRQLLQDQIMNLINIGVGANMIDRPGGIFVRAADQITAEDRILIQAASRVVLSDQKGSLAVQIEDRPALRRPVPRLIPSRTAKKSTVTVQGHNQGLLFDNGLGGFTADGKEYLITTGPEQFSPAPWSNVLANAEFGTVISESGMAYTWSENAHEYRLSPWLDDPVSDSSGEAFYLRDEETGLFWSPTPLPCTSDNPYLTRHGFGYSVFEHSERDIHSELWVYVAIDGPVKFSRLRIRNDSGRTRLLSATAYVELVLGESASKNAMHVSSSLDTDGGAILARNRYNTNFSERVVFLDTDREVRSVCGDRTEFLGRNGTMAHPEAMGRVRLSNRLGSALDPCAAMQVPFTLLDGEECELVFRLGSGKNLEHAKTVLRRYRGLANSRLALQGVHQYWNRTLSAIQVRTPDPALNVLANGWLIYQVLSSRLWGRSAYYQSGGAYGFRDQLQDVMALVHTEPGLVREHILRSAARQFEEGDVLHWWHPPLNQGARTRCSDDYLWLPAVVSHYIKATGDTGILDEKVAYITGRGLNRDEESAYIHAEQSEQVDSLYGHCCRAIAHSRERGSHGLPLIGSGDWNDGMNMVGIKGRGESVWLGFFLYATLEEFSQFVRDRNDQNLVETCQADMVQLRKALDAEAWDGSWYRRAYNDDGQALGSAQNSEGRIDSISQSWSVLSGAGDPEKSRMAMDSLLAHLVRRDPGLVLLLDPPFDSGPINPGYIKGYVPGVRENGGQYTHAAIWAAMACAKLGDGGHAWEIFNMINPVNHGARPEDIAVYKVEPYVMAADVYAAAPHEGRGGWTWYTGSAALMYRLILESLLGFNVQGDRLRLDPCWPKDWDSFSLDYRYHETMYHLKVRHEGGLPGGSRLSLDGTVLDSMTLVLINDLKDHSLEFVLAKNS